MSKNKIYFTALAAVCAGTLLFPGNVHAVEIEGETTQTSSETAAPETTATYDVITEDDLDDVFDDVDEEGIIHNEQQENPETGEIDSELPVTDTVLKVSDSVTYDTTNGRYTLQYGSSGDASSIVSNVLDGMLTNNAVYIGIGEELNGTLYRNGNEITNPDLTNLTEAGGYTLILTTSGGSEAGTFSFGIISQYTSVTSYELPDGCIVTSASCSGKSADASEHKVNFTDEGNYEISYTCTAVSADYTLRVSVDHTAPTLMLEAVDENNEAHSAVSLEDLEEGVTLYVTRDGEEYTAGTMLTLPGKYHLTLQDPAGNITEYAFTIYMYFTVSTIVFLGILGAMLLGLILYVIITRKRLRTR